MTTLSNDSSVSHQELLDLLKPFGQEHLLRFWDDLDEAAQQSLASQVHSIDWEQLQRLASSQTKEDQWADRAARAEVPPAITAHDFENPESYQTAWQTGADAIAAGKVAFVLVAGGQGSRLGFDHPKGMFPIGPVSNRTLYQILLEHARARAQQFNSRIPVYVMTSPPTHEASEKFLTENNWFGYPSEDIRIFCQGVMAAVDSTTGKALLESKSKIFVSPDGHGGTLGALDRSGCLTDMESRGIEHIFYGQVDNPLMQICDPALIGYHIQKKSELTTQAVRKDDPLQKVGNVVSVDGVVQIIEYSDLPDEVAKQTNEDGSLKLWAGNIAVHVFDRAFLQRVSSTAEGLPFHRAHKKVAFIDADGNQVTPDENNATKFERFIFDLLPEARNAIVCEVDAAKGFAAVKNAPPADKETPEWVKAAISNLHRSWLKSSGFDIPDDAVVEISPFFAVEPNQLKDKVLSGTQFAGKVFLK